MIEKMPRPDREDDEARSAKDERITKLKQEVEEIVDGLGKPMEDGIKEPVVYLMANGFPTVASCEGHIWTDEQQEKNADPSIAPWVDIVSSEPKGWKKSKEKKENWKMENARLQWKMFTLLDEFYKERNIPTDARLGIFPIGTYGMFRVSNMGRGLMEILPPEKQTERQPLYREEMRQFTEFLKKKYYET